VIAVLQYLLHQTIGIIENFREYDSAFDNRSQHVGASARVIDMHLFKDVSMPVAAQMGGGQVVSSEEEPFNLGKAQ
jgi:hypothetical protein